MIITIKAVDSSKEKYYKVEDTMGNKYSVWKIVGKDNPHPNPFLSLLFQGAVLDVEIQKSKDPKYMDTIKSAIVHNPAVPANAQPAPKTNGFTKEEISEWDKRKQSVIIRQNVLGHATEIFKGIWKDRFEGTEGDALIQIKRIAESLEAWVNR